jgi:hypothetical protein
MIAADSQIAFDMRPAGEDTGFAAPGTRPLGRTRRTIAFAELLTMIALAACTLVAATVITAGIARADGLAPIAGQHASATALAMGFGLLFAGIGGLTVIGIARGRRSARD